MLTIYILLINNLRIIRKNFNCFFWNQKLRDSGNVLLAYYEWQQQLAPQMDFDNFIEKVEKVCSKGIVRVRDRD